MPRAQADLNERLIKLVKKQPLLYDVGLVKGAKRAEKEAAWRKVALALRARDDAKAGKKTAAPRRASALKVAEVKQRWKNIRDSYVKFQKNEIAKANGEVRKRQRKPWRYAPLMGFLAPHVHVKDQKTPEIEMKQEQIEAVPVDDGLGSIGKEKFMENFNLNPVEHPVLSTHFLATPSPSFRSDFYQTNPQDKEDGIDLFFRGIADAVKSMHPMNQIRIQKEVANLVFDLKLRECQEVSRRS